MKLQYSWNLLKSDVDQCKLTILVRMSEVVSRLSECEPRASLNRKPVASTHIVLT